METVKLVFLSKNPNHQKRDLLKMLITVHLPPDSV